MSRQWFADGGWVDEQSEDRSAFAGTGWTWEHLPASALVPETTDQAVIFSRARDQRVDDVQTVDQAVIAQQTRDRKVDLR